MKYEKDDDGGEIRVRGASQNLSNRRVLESSALEARFEHLKALPYVIGLEATRLPSARDVLAICAGKSPLCCATIHAEIVKLFFGSASGGHSFDPNCMLRFLAFSSF